MEKERVTITLPRSLLETVDATVDGTNIRNRSHAVEKLIGRALGRNEVTTAFILAGGKGTRLKQLTKDTPKPMIKINNKPVIGHIVEWFKENKITKIVLGIGYKGDQIKEYFGNGSKWGVEVIYSEEREPLGTGGCLALARPHLDKTFIATYGDILTNFDIQAMVEFHKRNKAIMTIALKSVPDPSRFGVAELDGAKITGFVEKPKKGEAPTNLINAGVYVMEPEVLKGLKSPSSFERETIPQLVKEGKVWGYTFSGPWIDVGLVDTLEAAKGIW